ncbi:MAG: Asp-tRNA(Asn)/Glu-tRNA(Gln) amidotransferase subunit GatB [bacterium]
MTDIHIHPVIGLEIHVELRTASKLFCRCRNSFGEPPNTNVCPVCLGMPGVLPVINKKAVELAMKAGLALNCTICDFTKWDRKGYYYPDLPKNFQTSQYDLPLCVHGFLEIPLPSGETKKIRILRAHLEEDAGKNLHDNPSYTAVDLNRAGIPLLEIVSEPDMNSVEEAASYAREMRRLIRWINVSAANMEEGQMRFEPNINLHITWKGEKYVTPIIEVKNLNSFKFLEAAIYYEIERQRAEWEKDPEGYTLAKLGKQNMGFDVTAQKTVYQREKEEEHEYRYFPEPDLVPVMVDEKWRDEITSSIPELPLARCQRYREHYGLDQMILDPLTQDCETGDLLDKTVALGADPRRCATLLAGKGAQIANEKGIKIAEIGMSPHHLAQLALLLTEGKINSTAGNTIFERVIATGRSPEEVAREENLLVVFDHQALTGWIEEAIAENPKAVEEIKEGGKKEKKSFNFLVGQVMKKSRGTAPPLEVQKIVREKLKGAP